MLIRDSPPMKRGPITRTKSETVISAFYFRPIKPTSFLRVDRLELSEWGTPYSWTLPFCIFLRLPLNSPTHWTQYEHLRTSSRRGDVGSNFKASIYAGQPLQKLIYLQHVLWHVKDVIYFGWWLCKHFLVEHNQLSWWIYTRKDAYKHAVHQSKIPWNSVSRTKQTFSWEI